MNHNILKTKNKASKNDLGRSAQVSKCYISVAQVYILWNWSKVSYLSNVRPRKSIEFFDGQFWCCRTSGFWSFLKSIIIWFRTAGASWKSNTSWSGGSCSLAWQSGFYKEKKKIAWFNVQISQQVSHLIYFLSLLLYLFLNYLFWNQSQAHFRHKGLCYTPKMRLEFHFELNSWKIMAVLTPL